MNVYYDWLRATFKIKPMTNIKATKDVPPALTKGKGTPVGGIVPVTTAKLTTVCTAIIETSPVTSKD